MKFLLCIVSIVVFAFLISHAISQENQIRKLEYRNCGFIFYEDGSVGIQRDDVKRFKCMDDRR